MSDSLELKIRGLLAEQLGVEVGEVTPDANILDDLGADSLDVVEMVMALEETFDIEVPDEDVEEMRTVADVERAAARPPRRRIRRSRLRQRVPGRIRLQVPTATLARAARNANRSLGRRVSRATCSATACCSGPAGTLTSTRHRAGATRMAQ
jgi:acyl carrier protein